MLWGGIGNTGGAEASAEHGQDSPQALQGHLAERVLDGPLEGLVDPILAARLALDADPQVTDADRKCLPMNPARDGPDAHSNLIVGPRYDMTRHAQRVEARCGLNVEHLRHLSLWREQFREELPKP
jgi:hypothetical protein